MAPKQSHPNSGNGALVAAVASVTIAVGVTVAALAGWIGRRGPAASPESPAAAPAPEPGVPAVAPVEPSAPPEPEPAIAPSVDDQVAARGWDDDDDDDHGWDDESESDDDDDDDERGVATSSTSTIQAPSSAPTWNLGGSAAPVAPSSSAVSQATTTGS